MGRIGKLLSGVSSAVLLFLGASNVPAQLQSDEKVEQLPVILMGKDGLITGFVAETGGRYTEDTVEAAIRRMLEGMSADRVTELPKFVRDLQNLGLSPEAQVVAVETIISMLVEISGSLISQDQADVVIADILEEFAPAAGPPEPEISNIESASERAREERDNDDNVSGAYSN